MEDRELDKQIGVKVMGWDWMTGADKVGASILPRYSTDISAAMEVVEKIAAPGLHFMSDYLIQRNGQRRWFAQFLKDGLTDGLHNEWIEAETFPKAICLAALAAIETK